MLVEQIQEKHRKKIKKCRLLFLKRSWSFAKNLEKNSDAQDLEFSQVNIRSFAFAPGMIDTDMQAIIRTSNTPNKNMFEKKNLTNTKPAARLATWLASGEADDLAGKDLNIRDSEIIQRASL